MVYYLPILIIVMSNVAYHLSAKSLPREMDSFFFLSLLYFISGGISLGIYFFKAGTNLGDLYIQVKFINWVPFLFAFGIIGLEFGNILMYRVGWDISVGALVSSILLGLALIVIGYFFYKENISLKQFAGILFCLIGLVLINRN